MTDWPGRGRIFGRLTTVQAVLLAMRTNGPRSGQALDSVIEASQGLQGKLANQIRMVAKLAALSIKLASAKTAGRLTYGHGIEFTIEHSLWSEKLCILAPAAWVNLSFMNMRND